MSGILLLVKLTGGFNLRYVCNIQSFTKICQNIVHVNTQGKEMYEDKVMQIFRMEPGKVAHTDQGTEAGWLS